MRVDQAEQNLRERLTAAGLDVEHLDPHGTWRVFIDFAREPAEELADADDDMVIVQHGLYKWSDGRGDRFAWIPGRQFSLYRDGEYDHMEHLECMLFFEVTPDLREIAERPILDPGTQEVAEGTPWWCPTTRPDLLDPWISEVEQHDAFKAVMDATPLESFIRQEWI